MSNWKEKQHKTKLTNPWAELCEKSRQSMSINYVSSLLPGCSMNQFSWSALGQGEGGVLGSVCVVSTWPRQTGGCLNLLTECQIGLGLGALPNRGGTPGKLNCMYRNSIQGKEDKKSKRQREGKSLLSRSSEYRLSKILSKAKFHTFTTAWEDLFLNSTL